MLQVHFFPVRCSLASELSFSQKAITRETLVAIDSNIDDYASLVSEITVEADILILDPYQDGIEQITAILRQARHITHLYIVAHGSPGCLRLGSTELKLETIDRYTESLASWSIDDLSLYSCRVAAGEVGKGLLTTLHQITGATIVASTELLGSSIFGGVWNLNSVVSAVPSVDRSFYQSIFSESIQKSYSGVFSLQFDGVDDRVDASSTGINLNQSFTIEFWAKRASASSVDFVLGQGSANLNQGLHIGFRDGSSGNVFTVGFYGNDLDTPTGYTDTNWNHWAVTYDASTRQRIIYRNGTEVVRDTATSNYIGSGNITIGTALFVQQGVNAQTNPHFHGNVDEMRIWSRVRSQSEIQSTMNTVVSASSTGLVAYWQLDNNVTDATGGNDGTLVNGTAYSSNNPALSPINDNFANAMLLTGTTVTATGNNIAATGEVGEPAQSGTTNSSWWKWTAPSSGQYRIDTTGSNFDTFLYVYTGSGLGNLTQVAADDQSGGNNTSLLTLNTTAGTTYYISVDGSFSATGAIQLNIKPVNAAPTNINLSNSTIGENSANGTVVGNLSTVDANVGDSHTYSLLNSAGGRFTLVGNQIRVANGSLLDFETSATQTIRVRTTDQGGLFYDQDINITIANVNEAPTAIALNNASVAENAIGAVIGDVTVSDPDANSSHTFSVSDGRFEVINGQLKLKDDQSLDFELEPTVTLNLTAIDNGSPTQSYTQSFTLTVVDVPNDPPSPSKSLVMDGIDDQIVAPDTGVTLANSSFTIEFWAKRGSVDSDSFILSQGNQAFNQGLHIGFRSSNQFTAAFWGEDLDTPTAYTDTNWHHWAITYDANTRLRTIYQDGIVAAQDITTTNYQGSGNLFIGSYFGSGLNFNGNLDELRIWNQARTETEINAAKAIVIDPNSAGLVGYWRFDEGAGATAIDHTGGNNGTISGSPVWGAPAFSGNSAPTEISLSNSSIAENSQDGTVVATLTTEDSDASDTHTYTLVNNASGRFVLSGDQLLVANSALLDFENATSHIIRVRTTDAQGLSYEKDLTITLTNVNEAPTAIALSNASVTENALGAVIGNVTVSDPDANSSHIFTVSDARFEVVNGQLKLKADQSLDYSAEQNITLTVTATDNGTPALNYTESFVIAVTKENHAPTAIDLSSNTVVENASGAAIGILSVTDADADDIHTFTVSDARFEVANGQLQLKAGQSLNYEAGSTITFNITTTDNGNPALSYTKALTIAIIDANEVPTAISLSNSNISENTEATVIGTLNVSDPDANSSHTFTVSDARFEVVNGQLQLQAGQSLDYETEPSITLDITATDNGNPALSKTQSFTLNVTNVNEAPTAITLNNTTVAENGVAAIVGTLTVTDPDAGSSHTFTVSDTRFEVVNNQLKLKAGQSLDYETEPSITLDITATDDGNPALSKTESFTVDVTNVNEAPTAIALSNASIAENNVAGVVGTLSVTDPDANSSHTFTVSDARFEVVNNQLKLKAGQSLNFEATPTVTLNITATDNGNPALSQTQPFTVNVTNVNETPTAIALNNTTIAENAVAAVIGTLSVTDPDANSSHTFTVSDARFEVVNNQLKLKAGQSLDFEATPTVTLNVTATDNGNPALSRTQSFTVNVTNANDAPTAIALNNTTVAENAVAAVIGTLSVTDPDANSSHTFTVSDARFEVVNNQLKLKAGQSLDFEATPTVTLNVTATDNGNPALSRTQSFTVNVTNANDAPTAIALNNTTVAENAAAAVIGTLSATDPDAGNSHTFTVSDVRFEVVNNQLKLKAGQSLDFESGSAVTLNVTATDNGNPASSRTQPFTLNVTNVNETPTAIALSNASVAENTVAGVVGTLSVTDPDVGSSHTFTVSDARFEVVNNQLKLKAGQSLNYEATPTVTLNITATDNGNPALSRTQSFTLNVTNVNETPTAIALNNTTVAENAVAAVIGTLSVTDPDAGSGHTFTVSDARFEVVNNQLKLKAGQSLDFETLANVPIDVTATDNGNPALSKTQSFNITVTNVNDAPTTIALDSASVIENIGGVVIGNLSVTDQDVGNSHSFTVSDARFEIINKQLKLKAGQSLDFEKTPQVALNITATDNGSPALSKIQSFTITVNDVNEVTNTAPTNLTLSSTAIDENSPANTTIGQFNSADANAFNTFTYTLVSGTGSTDNALFTIVNNQLQLKSSPNYETKSSYAIRVRTTDQGGLFFEKALTITVNDLNETPTAIALTGNTVAENAIEAMIGTLSVTDPDAGSIHTFTVDDPRFAVINQKLKLKVGQSLDFESGSAVTLNIIATDNGNPALSKTQAFTISVTNVNEAPTAITLNNATIVENMAAGVIGTVTVSDPDAGSTHTFTVSDPRFEIVNQQLRLKAGQSLDFETTPTITLNVTATDNGNPALSKTQAFTVSVTNVNEAPTAIALSSATIAENMTAGVIGTVTVSDPDAGSTHTFTVSDPRFEVVNQQLKLKTGQSLDFEKEPTVTLNITATDNGNPALSRTQAFTVSVTNVNEAPTAIALSNATVAENAVAAVIGTGAVSDPDAGSTHTLAVDDSRFEIVNNQLRLKAGQSLDFEKEPTVMLNVTATDNGNPALSRTQPLTINVTNVNEAPTAITLSNMTIVENTVAGVIGTVAVSDPDALKNHTFTVSDNRFEIVNNQLKLKAGQSLNYEATDKVPLTITVLDAGTPNHTYAQSFTINVTNTNDPADTITITNTTVEEGSVGAVIGTLGVVDQDSSDRHSLTVSDNRFEIVNNQLKLKNGISLDFEKERNVAIDITATDDGVPPQQKTQRFTINVTNVNEPPVLTTYNSLKLDGSSFVKIPHAASLNLTGQPQFTIAAWFKVDAFDKVDQTIISKGNSWRIARFADSNGLRVDLAGYQYQVLSGTRNVNDGQWHHVAVVYDSSTSSLSLYVDGALDGQRSDISLQSDSSTGDLLIGENPQNPGRQFKGQIADVQLWNVARKPADIVSSRFSQANLTGSGLVGYWSLNEGTGTIAADAKGNNGTLINGASWSNTSPLTRSSFVTAKETPIQGQLQAAVDPDGDPLVYEIVRAPQNGQVTTNSNGTFSYTPNLDYAGSDSFAYRISDGKGFFLPPAEVNLDIQPVTVSVADLGSLNEGNASSFIPPLKFSVQLSQPSTQTITVNYSLRGTLTLGQDYTTNATSTTLTFQPGETEKTIEIFSVKDDAYEQDEVLELNLLTATAATIVVPRATLTLKNDDFKPAVGAASDSNRFYGQVSVSEGNSATSIAQIPISLSNTSYETITVDYTTADGTAKAGIDYIAKSGKVTFAPGETIQWVPIEIKGDTLSESNLSFALNLSNGVNTRQSWNGIVNITNDDTPKLSINDVTITEGNSGTKTVTFTVSLSNRSQQDVTVSYSTEDGSGTKAGTDYQAASGTLTFKPNEISKQVSVTINGNTTVNNPVRTVLLNLTNPQNATIGDGKGTLTIADDDPNLTSRLRIGAIKTPSENPFGFAVAQYLDRDMTQMKKAYRDMFAVVSNGWTKGEQLTDVQAIRWTGKLQAPASGEYELFVDNLGDDDEARLWVNGQLMVNRWNDPSIAWQSPNNKVALQKDQLYDIKLEYRSNEGPANVQLKWKRPDVNYASGVREWIVSGYGSPNDVIVYAYDNENQPANVGYIELESPTPLTTPTQVKFTTSGTAISGVDYLNSRYRRTSTDLNTESDSIYIQANQTKGRIYIVAQPDQIAEPAETVKVELNAQTLSGTGLKLVDATGKEVSTLSTELTIEDAPSYQARIELSEVFYNSDGTAAIQLRLTSRPSNGNVTVNLDFYDAPANRPFDSTQKPFKTISKSFTTSDWSTYQQIPLTASELPLLLDRVTYVRSSTTSTSTEYANLSALAVLNPFKSNNLQVTEGQTSSFTGNPSISIISNNTSEGGIPGQFRIQLDRPAPASGLNLHYQIAGTAQLGSDYGAVLPPGLTVGQVRIEPGATSAVLPITTLDDRLSESPETVELSVLGIAGLVGEYFDNQDLTNLKFVRTDNNIDFDWGDRSPDPSIQSDTFSVRWTGKVLAPTTGTYTFFTQANDGVRLWINGQRIINQWSDRTTASESSGQINLEAGKFYDIRLDYYDASGAASTQLSWQAPGIVKQVIPPSYFYNDRGLTAEYFADDKLTNLKLTRQDPNINFFWGFDAPAADIPKTQFSTRWTGKIQASDQTGSYTFFARVQNDDGVRLWVNDSLVIDGWNAANEERQGNIQLEAGKQYNFRLEYRQNQHASKMQLYWQGPGFTKQIISPAQFSTTTPIKSSLQILDDDKVGLEVVNVVNTVDVNNQPVTVYESKLDPLLTTEAGQSQSFAIRLRSQPAAPVTITLENGNVREGKLSTSQLTFTSSNWNVYQTVVLTGVDDTARDGDAQYLIRLQATSTDQSYNGYLDSNGQFSQERVSYITATNLDNDSVVNGETVPVPDPQPVASLPTATIVPIGDSTTPEADGVTKEFEVRLSSPAGANGAIVYLSTQNSTATQQDFSLNLNHAFLVPQIQQVQQGGQTQTLKLFAGPFDRKPSDSQQPGTGDRIDIGSNSHPVFGDFDGDGDLDAVIGAAEGNLKFFVNIGSANQPEFRYLPDSDASNPFKIFNDYSRQGAVVPALGDIDGDQDLDLVVRTGNGSLQLLKNVGSVSQPKFSVGTLSGITSTVNTTPTLADLNGDGKADLILSTPNGLQFYQGGPTFTLTNTTAFQSVTPASGQKPTFADWDNDGDLDLFMGKSDGTIAFYNNSGSRQAANFLLANDRNPFTGLQVGTGAAPNLSDLDGDGDLDAIVGRDDGELFYAENMLGVRIAPGQTSARIPVRLRDDQIADGDKTVAIDVLAFPNAPYEVGTTNASASVKIIDSEIAGVTVTRIGDILTSEDGTKKSSISVVLNSQPIAPVKVYLGSQNTAEALLGSQKQEVYTLTFTPDNWKIPQTVDVFGMDDAIDDGDVAYNIIPTVSSEDENYRNLNLSPISFRNQDNDTAAVTITTIPSVQEGQVSTYLVQLKSRPLDTVEITMLPTNSQIQFTGSRASGAKTLTFNPANWNVPQSVQVEAVDDTRYEGKTTTQIDFVSRSSDPNYDNIAIKPTTVTVLDNDLPTVRLIGGLSASEVNSTPGYFLVTVDSPVPAENLVGLTVRYEVTGGTANQGNDYRTFTGTAQIAPGYQQGNIFVMPIDDSLIEGQEPDRLETTSIKLLSGTGYLVSPTASQATLKIMDDDKPGVQIIEPGEITTVAEGIPGVFYVALLSEPSAPVTVALTDTLTSGKQLEFVNAANQALSSTTLTFNANNWYVPQPVMVQGVDDGLLEPPDFHTASIKYQISSADSNYGSNLKVPDQTIRILDRPHDRILLIDGLNNTFDILQNSLNNAGLPIVGSLRDKLPAFLTPIREALTKQLGQESTNPSATRIKTILEGALKNLTIGDTKPFQNATVNVTMDGQETRFALSLGFVA